MSVLNVHHYGDPQGRPMVAVHGITGHGARYRRMAEEGWPHRHTVAVDLRGHGRSTDAAPWSIPQHVRDLEDTFDANGFGAVDVVGHSYGGAIGLALLATAPARVARLVMLDPALEIDGEQGKQNALRTMADPGHASIEAATAARKEFLAQEGHWAVPEEVGEHLVQHDDGRFRWRFFPPAVVTGWGEVCNPLPTTLTPRATLLVVADKAGLVRDSTIASLRALLGDALSVVHLDCGHMVYWERYAETVATVKEFLAA